MTPIYSELNADKILTTLIQLESRIQERFPYSGLLKVSQEFKSTAQSLELIAFELKKPIWWVRVSTWACVLVLLFILVSVLSTIFSSTFRSATDVINHFGISDFFQVTESAINDLIFFSFAAYFLVSAETRIKRRRSLKALHSLRSIAHVIDMHQLTKDPVNLIGDQRTTSSPIRTMTTFELTRYLDYCSEMLAIISKIGALFSQNMVDEIVHSHVNDLSDLTQGLSAKIWQKIMIMNRSGS